MNSPLKILHEFFGYDNFRSGQLEIIEAVLKNNNVLAVLPTGAGKSVCYQIPAFLSENFSIVISPLIALMKDQVDGLNRKKEVAAFINSTMGYSETEEVFNKISLGSIKLLYLSPEKLDSLKFAERIKELKPANLFIDEAHCISEWGHNFRPSYLKIKDFINHIGIKKVFAFTATATPEVREDIIQQLGFKEPKIFVRGFERDNLNLRVLQIKNKKKKCVELIRESGTPAIIYTSSRKKAEEVAEYLNMNGIKCNYYHAGVSAPERRRVQEDFLDGTNEIIAATNAFGMGIDKANIRLIIHYNTPGSIESYYQEIGRAGRDGKESFCYLLHDESDLAIQNFFISASHPNKELIQKVYKAICDFNRIAVGSTSNKELIVDRDYISKYVGVEVSQGILHSTLKYLENSGYIRRISEYEKKDSLQILFSRDKLKEFIKTSTYYELNEILVFLLREFGSSIFTSTIKISAANLAIKLSIHEQHILESLNILDNMGIVSFQQAITKETILLPTPRVSPENLVLNYKLINESYLNSQRKLDKMVELVYTNECRFKFILNYFGETVEDYRCGKCDNCTSFGRMKDSTAAYLSEIILETIEEANEEIPASFLIKILKGEKIKESAALFKHFGSCRKFSLAEIKGVLTELISKGKVLKSKSKRNFISLPKKEKAGLKKIKVEDQDSIKSQDYYDELFIFNSLREIRKKAAERFMQSGYLICPDNVLKEVAHLRPKNKSELLSINGFNNRMFNKVGNDFLDIIKNFRSKEPEKKTFRNKPSLPYNIIETKKLLDKKYTLKEISETRKLTEAVISMQIESIIEFEPGTDITALFGKDVYEKIIEEADKGFENVKELKERLPSKISYGQLRIVLAKRRTTL
ncbi:MAG: RecQ family ATP-dependent DNA helicase [Chlorobium sp.]|nr:RecQ family ATP-dependent DNA helicase [Chlorobium sp.]